MSGGGSIGSLLYQGRELVNHADYGRYIQLSFYEGNQQYGFLGSDAFGSWGWNPIQAGSRAYNGARVLEYRSTGGGVYIKAYGKEWAQKDTDSDVMFETWAWLRGSYFEVHVRATHIGSDTHAAAGQEFPAAYFATSLTKQFSYFGVAPFTAQPIDRFSQRARFSCGAGVTPTENWVAYANANGRGLILALPPQPYLLSSWAFCMFTQESPAVGYAAPMAVFDNPPNAVHEATFYLVPGLIDKGRAIVYDLIPHTTWTFNLNTSEGWRQTSGTPAVKNGILTAHLAPDDFLTYPNLNTPGASALGVTMAARAKDIPAGMCLYFLTADDSSWDSDKSACVGIATGEFRAYTFDFRGNSIWRNGIITQLGLGSSEPGVFDIDEAWVTTNVSRGR